MRARLGDRRERLTELLEPLRRRRRIGRRRVRRIPPRSEDDAGAVPEQRHGNPDDEREGNFERHVRWLF